MTNKFKTLLKTTAALATLLASSQTWGADPGVWLDPVTGGTLQLHLQLLL